MRQVGWAFVAAAALMALGAPVAEAGITCKIIPSWCPADEHDGKNKNIHVGFQSDSHYVPHTSVPEPASLLLLGAGVTAVGAAVARRRKRNKSE